MMLFTRLLGLDNDQGLNSDQGLDNDQRAGCEPCVFTDRLEACC